MFIGRHVKREDNIFLIISSARGRWLVSGTFCAAFVCPSGRVIWGFACNRSPWLHAYPLARSYTQKRVTMLLFRFSGHVLIIITTATGSLRVSPEGIFSSIVSNFFLFFFTPISLFIRLIRQTLRNSVYSVVVYLSNLAGHDHVDRLQ